jgi:hypothetical protein
VEQRRTPATQPDHRFAVRVKPGSRRASVGGTWAGRLGPALIVAVTAPAVDGKANKAVLAALAAALDVPSSRFTLVTGDRGRDKLVAVRPAPPDLAARVDLLLSGVGADPRTQ